MKKILFINSVLNFGSTGTMVKSISSRASQEGFECFYAIGRGESLPNNRYYYKINSKIDFFLHALFSRLFDSEGLHSKRATRHLIYFIKRLKPDVINLHNIHGHFLNYPILFNFLKTFDTKIFWTLHDPWAYTGHCSGYLLKNCSKFETGCNQCPALKSYPKSYGVDQSRRNYHLKRTLLEPMKDKITIIVPSEWLKLQILLSFLKHYQVKLIHNGISLPDLNPTKQTIFVKKYEKFLSKKIILGVAAKWEERKGLKFFWELSKQISDDHHIIIIGEVNRWQIKKSKHLTYLGQIKNRSEINFLMSHALCFVNPTLEDNFPTTNLEAQACGIPVITFDTGGSKESISPNSGIVTKTKTATAIYQAIQTIKSDTQRFTSEQCIENARIFNVNTFTNHYINFFKSV